MLGIKGGLRGGRGNSQISFSLFLFFSLSFCLSLLLSFFIFPPFHFPSLLLSLPIPVLLFLSFMLSAFLTSMCSFLCVCSPLAPSHRYISFIRRGNICPSVPPKDCHREPKPLALSMTEDITTKPPLSVTVFHILSALVLSFSVNRHIRVYWCCKC